MKSQIDPDPLETTVKSLPKSQLTTDSELWISIHCYGTQLMICMIVSLFYVELTLVGEKHVP